MKVLEDCFGQQLRHTEERLAHILGHPEMAGMGEEIGRVLRQQQRVRRSRPGDADTMLAGTLGSRQMSWIPL